MQPFVMARLSWWWAPRGGNIMDGQDQPAFEDFVGARSNALQRFGYLLTGD